jgi:uncharacterized repeat protein (TIGR01451 family)
VLSVNFAQLKCHQKVKSPETKQGKLAKSREHQMIQMIQMLNNLTTLSHSTLLGEFGNQTTSNLGNSATLEVCRGTNDMHIVLASSVTVSAAFTASNNVLIPVQTITRTDVTTVTAADSGALTLLKEVCNATVTPACNGYTTQNTGKGGDLLRYRITYTNTGASAVNNVVIQDATPPYTTFQSADVGALPNSLTACNKTTPAGTIACTTAQIAGGTGSVKWVFTGTLLSGQSGTVTFVVQVQP